MKKLFRFIPFALAGAMLLQAGGSGEKVRKAPDFSYELTGKGAQSLSQFQGKVVALEFIFTTCPHCQAASRYLATLQSELGGKGLQVIDVAVNPNADLLVDNFAKDYGVNYPVGWTTSDKMTAFMGFPSARYVVPQLALIDRKGYIHWQTPATEDENWDKLMTHDAIKQHIEELLSQGNATTSVRKQSGVKMASTPGSHSNPSAQQ